MKSLVYQVFLFTFLLYTAKTALLLNIPIKSLTNSNIIYTDFNDKKLESFITNDKLDYNQFYIDLTLVGNETKILKLGLDTTYNTNLFSEDSCPGCLDSDKTIVFWNTTYKQNKIKIGQISANILLNDDELTLPNYPANILKSSKVSNNMPFDGILGLGFESFSRMPIETYNTSQIRPTNLLNYLWKNNYIETRQFSFALYRDVNKTKLIMGGYDGTLLNSPFIYHPLVNSKKWMLNLTGLYINKMPLYTEAHGLLFDSTTSNLIGPKSDVLNIISNINAMAGKRNVCEEDNEYFLKCNCEDLPFEEEFLFDISFEISGSIYPIYLEDLMISYQETSKQCYFALGYYEDGSMNEKVWIAGTKFFERYYVMFNADNKEIAIAEVNLEMLMGTWFLSQTEMEILSVVGFILLLVTLTYFMYIILKEGKSSKEFNRISNTEQNISYLEQSDVFEIGKSLEQEKQEENSIEMKDLTKKPIENKEENELDGKKGMEKVDNIEESHTV